MALVIRLALPPGVFDFILPDLHSANLQELQQKESVIQELAADNIAKEHVISEKERELEENRATQLATSGDIAPDMAVHPLAGIAFKLRRRIKWIMRSSR